MTKQAIRSFSNTSSSSLPAREFFIQLFGQNWLIHAASQSMLFFMNHHLKKGLYAIESDSNAARYEIKNSRHKVIFSGTIFPSGWENMTVLKMAQLAEVTAMVANEISSKSRRKKMTA